MAQLPQAFDANQYNPSQSAGQLPVGKHLVVIMSSELKGSKNNENSGYVQLNLEVVDGPNKGATGPYRLNLYNESQKTVEIAHNQLCALSHALNVFVVQNTEQLHGIPFIAEVQLQKGDNPNGYTEVKRVFDASGNEPGKQGQQAAQPQTAPVQQQQQQQVPAPGHDQAAQPGAAGWQQAPVQQPAQQPAVQPPVQEQAPVAGWQQAPAQGGVAPAPGAPAGDKPAWCN